MTDIGTNESAHMEIVAAAGFHEIKKYSAKMQSILSSTKVEIISLITVEPLRKYACGIILGESGEGKPEPPTGFHEIKKASTQKVNAEKTIFLSL